MLDPEETTGNATEAEETTQVFKPSDEAQESSSESTESERETKTTPESEDKTDKTKEESFEAKLERLSQSKADKANAPLQKANDELRTQVETLTNQVNEKTWDRNMKDLFDEESDDMGIDVATKKKAGREKVREQVLEFQKNSALVNKLKPELEKKETSLNIVERNHLVRDKLWPLFFPEEKKDLDAYNEAFKKFDKANDPDEVETILEVIREGLKVKADKFVPDSGQQTGNTTQDTSKLTGRQMLERAIKNKK